ncbi:MAG: hypothetical protein GXP29_14425 [Planctomycetes bacterium]|nr:hypothetical protein [Planctomycetota bacterium]
MCHRYQGLGRISEDGQTVRLYHVDSTHYDKGLGPHSRLKCTDCHPRNEVAVIPHKTASAVDCTNACHLSSPNKLPRVFAHGGIAEMLEKSAHTAEVLDECNALLGEPLRPEQARCLLCHDEPTFYRTDGQLLIEDIFTSRCDVCHDERLPENTPFTFRHVMARSRPARTHEQLARSCALCHSNERIRNRYDMPDSIASYLASFHGKAMLLGSERTAGCLDCHVGAMQNIHLMKPHDDPMSSTHAGRLPDTCRSSACHPAAGALVSAAAMHMELTPSRQTALVESDDTNAGTIDRDRSFLSIEFIIAAMFVVLIACTFGPSAVLQLLELLQLALGRHNARHHEYMRLDQQIKATPAGLAMLSRFSVHQRVQHWLLAVSFTALVATGFPIKFAGTGWASWLIDVMGGLGIARRIHRYSGLVLVVGAIYHMAYVGLCLWRDKQRRKVSWFKAIMSLPLVVSPGDVKELLHLLGFLLFIRRTRPAPRRFGLKEKFEYFGVFWGCTLLGATGLLMWANSWTSHYVSGRMLTVASLVHTLEAYLAILHVGVFHMIGVIFAPHVFPLHKAMFTGETPSAEMADAHAGMLIDAAEALSIDRTKGGFKMTDGGHQPKQSRRIAKEIVVRIYSLGLLVLVTWVSYMAFAYLFASVFSPKLTPERFINRPLRMEVASLTDENTSIVNDADITAPLDHFHGLGRVAFTRPQSGCLTSGCHSPLPHSQDKATRALANFHVAFLDCAMCHHESLTAKTKIGWLDPATGDAQTTPALLRLIALFEKSASPEGNDGINALVKKALEVAPTNALLEHLLLEMETSTPDSPVQRHALEQLRAALPNVARGAYGVVIGPLGDDGFDQDAMQTSTQQYFITAGNGPRRKLLLDQTHKQVMAKPKACQQCHDFEPARIDYTALGYPPSRASQLRNLAIANMVQRIREGKPFHLPQILETPPDD